MSIDRQVLSIDFCLFTNGENQWKATREGKNMPLENQDAPGDLSQACNRIVTRFITGIRYTGFTPTTQVVWRAGEAHIMINFGEKDRSSCESKKSPSC
jgi:hypothetical protein